MEREDPQREESTLQKWEQCAVDLCGEGNYHTLKPYRSQFEKLADRADESVGGCDKVQSSDSKWYSGCKRYPDKARAMQCGTELCGKGNWRREDEEDLAAWDWDYDCSTLTPSDEYCDDLSCKSPRRFVDSCVKVGADGNPRCRIGQYVGEDGECTPCPAAYTTTEEVPRNDPKGMHVCNVCASGYAKDEDGHCAKWKNPFAVDDY